MTTTLAMKAHDERARFLTNHLTGDPQPQDLGDLIRFASALPAEMETVWISVSEAVERGDVDDIDAMGEWLRLHFGNAVALVSKIHQLAEKQRFTGHKFLSIVSALEARRDEIITAWPWSHLPLPTPDPEATRRSQEELARGEGIPIEELLAAVQRGEWL